MPCHYEILTDENLVSSTFFGHITTHCVLKLLDDVERDPKHAEGMFEFDDMRDVVDFDITATDIAHIAELIAGFNTRNQHPKKNAILAPYGPGRAAAYGFKKMVENSKNLEVEVFDEISDAMGFLGLQDCDSFWQSMALGQSIH